VIVVNTLVLMLKWPNMDNFTLEMIDITNYVCNAIFLMEVIIKITAFGTRFFRDGWNVFDFIIVAGSLIFIHPIFKKQKNSITMIRAFRVGRVLKLFRNLKSLQVIFQTFLTTLPALMNVGFLMLLIIYLFAIIGVQYFGTVKINAPMTSLINFQSMPTAFLTLFRVATGENWNDLMEAVSLELSATNYCI